MKEIGKITHYYDQLGVAVVELKGTLKVGDSIKIKKGEHEFEQPVESLQIEREEVPKAKAGQTVGLKVASKTSEGSKVYLV